MKQKPCRDCLVEWPDISPPSGWRPIVEGSGGRCATHWREEKQRRKDSAHEKRVQDVYGLGPGDYERLYEFQGGLCAICRRARGLSRKLAVDHKHSSGLVRGLLCSPCNKILGHLRDDAGVAYGIYDYLTRPPAWKLGIVAVHKEKREDG